MTDQLFQYAIDTPDSLSVCLEELVDDRLRPVYRVKISFPDLILNMAVITDDKGNYLPPEHFDVETTEAHLRSMMCMHQLRREMSEYRPDFTLHSYSKILDVSPNGEKNLYVRPFSEFEKKFMETCYRKELL
jgi:hypothetical protein